ncbi:MAG TPA: CD225/dispanin family protein [Pyrinomonadaceae bacterium]|nr:CD225/dispanin family protein [Pyrinomonadaceae bacterium]
MSEPWTPPSSSSAGGSANVPNYLVPAIISIFCCWPLGIVAVIFAAQVNGKVASGDIAGAEDASKKAKLFSYISIGIGLVVGVIYLLLTILGIGLGAMQG